MVGDGCDGHLEGASKQGRMAKRVQGQQLPLSPPPSSSPVKRSALGAEEGSTKGGRGRTARRAAGARSKGSRKKVAFWSLCTLASEDFDPKRLTERQQVAYFAAVQAADGAPREPGVALHSSPFRLDRLMASMKKVSPTTAVTSGTAVLSPARGEGRSFMSRLSRGATPVKEATLSRSLTGGAQMDAQGETRVKGRTRRGAAPHGKENEARSRSLPEQPLSESVEDDLSMVFEADEHVCASSPSPTVRQRPAADCGADGACLGGDALSSDQDGLELAQTESPLQATLREYVERVRAISQKKYEIACRDKERRQEQLAPPPAAAMASGRRPVHL